MINSGIGKSIASLKLPIVVVQEGGYLTQTLGLNAKSFFNGIQMLEENN